MSIPISVRIIRCVPCTESAIATLFWDERFNVGPFPAANDVFTAHNKVCNCLVLAWFDDRATHS